MYINIYSESNEDGFPEYIHVWDDRFGYKKVKHIRYGYKISDNGNYVSIYGQKCDLVRRWSREDVNNGLILESDVNATSRYLIDNYTYSDTPSDKHVVMFLDIEIDAVAGLPDPTLAENTITSIAYYTDSENEYVVHLLDEKNEMQDYVNDANGEIVKVYTHADERKLLSAFFGDYERLSPTIISTWNGDNFDIPYIYNRLNNVFGDNSGVILSPVDLVDYSEFRQAYMIAGVSSLDYMKLYRKLTFDEKNSYSLDNISKIELGHGKITYASTLNKLFEEDKQKFIDYNVNDVRLIKQLDDKLKFISLALGICHKGHVLLEDIYFPSRYLEGAILTYLKKQNRVVPNKRSEKGEKFSGAYVKEPEPGLYDWVVDLDATSMYPSIIMSLNISPETKVKKIDNWNIELFRQNSNEIVNDTNWTSSYADMRKKLGDKYCISPNGVVYKRYIHNSDGDVEGFGVIPTILNKWFDERVEYRKLAKDNSMIKEKYEYYDRLQYIQKVLLNSLYGVLGLNSFRFYDRDNAEAVTMTGVSLIKFAENSSNFYFKSKLKNDDESKSHIIYTDTDSLFFSLADLISNINEKTDDQIIADIIDAAKDIQTFVNKSVNVFADKFLNLDVNLHRFVFKQELIAKTAFWTGKKRYALRVINDTGRPVNELKMKGMDVVRSSFPKIFKIFMKQALSDILDKQPVEYLDKEVLELKKQVDTAYFIDLSRPTSIKEISKYTDNTHDPFLFEKKGAPVHVKAAIAYNDFIRYLNLEHEYRLICNGEKIKWLYLKENPFHISQLAFRDTGDDPAEVLEFVEKYASREKIFDSEMTNKLQNLYNALKWGKIPTLINQNFTNFFEFE